jgi:small subunit ribosomal protein S3Ae
LKGRIVEASLADLQKDEDQGHKKMYLRIDEVVGTSALTNFHGLDLTADKYRSLVRKWQSLIETNVEVKTLDGYVLRIFVIAFTRRRPHQLRKTTYAQARQGKLIRKKMVEIVQNESNCELRDLVQKL